MGSVGSLGSLGRGQFLSHLLKRGPDTIQGKASQKEFKFFGGIHQNWGVDLLDKPARLRFVILNQTMMEQQLLLADSRFSFWY